jgi:hypothetical protein
MPEPRNLPAPPPTCNPSCHHTNQNTGRLRLTRKRATIVWLDVVVDMTLWPRQGACMCLRSVAWVKLDDQGSSSSSFPRPCMQATFGETLVTPSPPTTTIGPEFRYCCLLLFVSFIICCYRRQVFEEAVSLKCSL